MIAFDADVLTGILAGRPDYIERSAGIPARRHAIPIIVVEEITRGRLNVVRRAEAGKSRVSIERAYELLERSFVDLRSLRILSYTAAAEALFRSWRQQKIRGSTHDLRIAAICIVHEATLISGNRRDFEHVPGLSVEFWQ